MLIFQPLSRTSLRAIVGQLMNDVTQRLAAQSNIALRISAAASDAILDAAYEPAYGARPLRRYIDRVIVTALARLVLGDTVPQHSSITIDVAAEGCGQLDTPFSFTLSHAHASPAAGAGTPMHDG